MREQGNWAGNVGFGSGGEKTWSGEPVDGPGAEDLARSRVTGPAVARDWQGQEADWNSAGAAGLGQEQEDLLWWRRGTRPGGGGTIWQGMDRGSRGIGSGGAGGLAKESMKTGQRGTEEMAKGSRGPGQGKYGGRSAGTGKWAKRSRPTGP